MKTQTYGIAEFFATLVVLSKVLKTRSTRGSSFSQFIFHECFLIMEVKSVKYVIKQLCKQFFPRYWLPLSCNI